LREDLNINTPHLHRGVAPRKLFEETRKVIIRHIHATNERNFPVYDTELPMSAIIETANKSPYLPSPLKKNTTTQAPGKFIVHFDRYASANSRIAKGSHKGA
jgi:hypothetical protein